MKKKDVSTINNSIYYESDEHIDTISDSNKQVYPRNNPIEETHIVDRVCSLSVRVGLFESAFVTGGSIEPITNVLENSRMGPMLPPMTKADSKSLTLTDKLQTLSTM